MATTIDVTDGEMADYAAFGVTRRALEAAGAAVLSKRPKAGTARFRIGVVGFVAKRTPDGDVVITSQDAADGKDLEDELSNAPDAAKAEARRVAYAIASACLRNGPVLENIHAGLTMPEAADWDGKPDPTKPVKRDGRGIDQTEMEGLMKSTVDRIYTAVLIQLDRNLQAFGPIALSVKPHEWREPRLDPGMVELTAMIRRQMRKGPR